MLSVLVMELGVKPHDHDNRYWAHAFVIASERSNFSNLVDRREIHPSVINRLWRMLTHTKTILRKNLTTLTEPCIWGQAPCYMIKYILV